MEKSSFVLPQQQSIESIQLLRGLACVAVLFFHCHQILPATKYYGAPLMGGFWSWGRVGVDLFFVISGFIMAYIHYDDYAAGRGVRRFISSRFSRIYAPYWPILAIIVAAYFCIPSLGGDAGRDPRNLGLIAKSFFLAPSFHPIMSVTWSLQHEVFFYGIILLMLLSKKIGSVIFFLWQLTAFSVSAFGWNFGESAAVLSPFEIQFVIGIAAMFFIRRFSVVKYPVAILCAGLSAVTLLAVCETAIFHQELHGYARTIPYGLAFAMVLVGGIYTERSFRFRIGPALTLLGAASYSIYLLHYDFITMSVKFLKASGLIHHFTIGVAFLTIAALAVIGGVAYHLAIELPLCGRLKSVFARKYVTVSAQPLA